MLLNLGNDIDGLWLGRSSSLDDIPILVQLGLWLLAGCCFLFGLFLSLGLILLRIFCIGDGFLRYLVS